MDKCNRCNKPKAKDGFTRCINCRKDKNKQAKRYYKKWNTLTDERRAFFKRRNRNAALKRKYGISLEVYEEIFASQKGFCGICGQELINNKQKGWGGKREPCVDHDHKTGKVRGILCRGCNLALSMIEDQDFQQKSNQYLSKF